MTYLDKYKAAPEEYANKKYSLRNAEVYASHDGYHFTADLDTYSTENHNLADDYLKPGDEDYISSILQSNKSKFVKQVSLVEKHLSSEEKLKVLDIGCGGGLFLSLLKEKGAEVAGIEVSSGRASYARKHYGIDVYSKPIEDVFWKNNFSSYFDVVTLWDVIEHVNYPYETIKAASGVLRKGGILALDTPCRDSFYYRFGEATYALSKGKYPTFLNSMYSSHRFGHKQIFTTGQISNIFDLMGFEPLELNKFHELSFPYDYYLKKMFKSDLLTICLMPFVKMFFKVFPIKNKMIAVGRK